MADLYPVAGAKFYIGPAIPSGEITQTQAEAVAEGDWDEVDGWVNAGSYGDKSNMIETKLINRNRVVKQKGTKDAGNWTNQFAEIEGDAGQDAMDAAEQSPNNYWFRVIYNDMPDGGTSGSTHYMVGLVNGWNDANGDADTIRMKETEVGINSNIVRVAAA